MPDDTFLNLRNERNQHNPLVAQAVNQISLIPTAKSLFIDETNCGTIFRIFTAHDHVVVYAHRVALYFGFSDCSKNAFGYWRVSISRWSASLPLQD
jgi:hypothetical protein